jgi:hypothetical protein
MRAGKILGRMVLKLARPMPPPTRRVANIPLNDVERPAHLSSDLIASFVATAPLSPTMR